MKQQIQTQDIRKLNREQRGKLIFERGRIAKKNNYWVVGSQTSFKAYKVSFNGHEPTCNCPDCTLRKGKCKHIYAVEFYIKRQIDEEGKITETKGVKITYSQKWSAYNKAQTNEKLIFMKLLKDLCSNIEQPDYKFGHPSISFQDMAFCMAYKVYSTLSARRFMSDLKIAKEMGLIEQVPHHNILLKYFKDKSFQKIIQNLIKLSALPLKEVEKDFALDSSGFSTCRFTRWHNYKWGKDKKQRIWLKAHINTGVKTNIITAFKITEGYENDSPQLKGLVEETCKNFNIFEQSGDKAYSSKKNLEFIEEKGAVPFIPFKKNVTGKRGGCAIWKKMYYYFMYKNDEFMTHYNKRSNVETTFHMIKAKFEERLRSKSETSQVNELMLKLLCHNICCVIQSICELGIKAEFNIEQTNEIKQTERVENPALLVGGFKD
ncbi:MAG: transposase [Nanoarchaeota archaeon]|nr:transposase [Nanoarchaeota archaeon]